MYASFNQVVPDGPADHAVPRLEKGDILKEIDGVVVSSLAHAKQLILGSPGSMVAYRKPQTSNHKPHTLYPIPQTPHATPQTATSDHHALKLCVPPQTLCPAL
jgi:hypothetical protein